jgi:hypothetical protein
LRRYEIRKSVKNVNTLFTSFLSAVEAALSSPVWIALRAAALLNNMEL